jgi:C4-type Zn-finger protein
MASPTYWLDEMDSCRRHGVAAMRHTPVEGETPLNLDHWACSQCGFRPSDIDWMAVIREDKADEAT